MARAKRSELSGKEKRLAKPVRGKPYWEVLGDGVGVGYRRNRGAGTWVGRKSDGAGGYETRALGTADDYEDADGHRVLSWAQAQQMAFKWAREKSRRRAQLTVGDAVDLYEAELRIQGGDLGNVRRLRRRLGNEFPGRIVAALTPEVLANWRDGLGTDLEPESVNRTCTPLKAALNLAADRRPDEITNRAAWRDGLKALEAENGSRNIILSDAVVQRIVLGAYDVGEDLGLLVEVLASTGARYSQLARVNVADLQVEANPRVMMPSSRKGRRGRKKASVARPVPIQPGLARRLQVVSAGRGPSDPLLVKPSGERWSRSDHTRLFARAVARARLQPSELGGIAVADVTIYALRHSSIARQLLKGVPVRVVAALHDTSVVMIERNYSALIADHSDAIARPALLDFTAAAA